MIIALRGPIVLNIRYLNKYGWKGAKDLFHSKHILALHRHCSTLATENVNNISENMFARKIIETNPHYKDIMVPCYNPRLESTGSSVDASLDNVNINEISTDELCELFSKLSSSASIPISHPQFNNLRLALKEKCHTFSDDQLAEVLKNLSCWPLNTHSKSPLYSELYGEFDKVCLSRWKEWNLRKVFIFMDLWYGLKVAKFSDFFYKASTKLAHYPRKLSPQQVVLLLFYLNLLRTATKNAKMFELEYRLEEVASELTLEELGVAVMGFFKADKALFNEKLMNHLIDRVIKEIKTVPDITFAAIMKALRKSIPTTLWPRIEELFNAVSGEVHRLSVQSCVHASLVATKPQFLHESLLQQVSQKVVENIENCRLKEMEKTVFLLTQLVFEPQTNPCIYQAVLGELEKSERNAEIEKYPKAFIALIHYFCLKGIYPQKHIHKILNLDFIQSVYGRHKYTFGREVLCIDSAVELFIPSYTGPRLPEGIRNYLSKRYSEYLPDPSRKLSRHQSWHLEIIQTAEILFGKEFISVKYLLPSHPRADIVVHLDEDMKPLPMADCLSKAEDFTGPLKAPSKNYYALIVGSKNVFLYNSTKLNGETTSKVNQLKCIGYTPVIVSFDDWPSSSTYEKVQHLKKLISSARQVTNK